MRNTLPILSLFMLFAFCAQSQDLNQVGKEPLLKVNGGVTAQTVFYNAQGIPARRDPFFWVVNANLTLNFLGVSAPFSATFTSQESQFSQPFNQYGISPKYKAITAHLGWRSLSYSELTMAGMQFLGAGVEVQPKDIPIYVSALYGRFARAVDPLNIPNSAGALPAYERWGFATKVGFKPKFGTINLNLFRGHENPNSITKPDPALEIDPGANLTVGIDGNARITSSTSVRFEVAHSIYTQNLELQRSALDAFTYADNLGNIIPTNASTTENNGVILKLNQKIKSVTLNLGYRRLDPNFQSMGTPFLNNDIENITAGFTAPLLKGRINISSNGGFQRDNLDNSKKDRMTRLILNANINAKVASWWNLNLNAGNFNSSTYMVRMLDLDSLNFFQVTRNLALSNNFSFGGASKLNSSVFSNINLQDVEDSQGTGSTVFNAIVGYNGMLKDIQTNFSVSGNYFQNLIDTNRVEGYGPTANIAKQFLKNRALNVSLNFTYLINVFNGERTSQTQNIGMRANYKLGKRHSLGAQSNIVQQSTYNAGGNTFTELRAMFNYGFRF